jgi:hypothetical protein
MWDILVCICRQALPCLISAAGSICWVQCPYEHGAATQKKRADCGTFNLVRSLSWRAQQSLVWVPTTIAGEGPAPRKGAAAGFVMGRFVLIFSGKGAAADGSEVLLDDMWALEFDPETQQTTAHVVAVEGPRPPARTGAVLQVRCMPFLPLFSLSSSVYTYSLVRLPRTCARACVCVCVCVCG